MDTLRVIFFVVFQRNMPLSNLTVAQDGNAATEGENRQTASGGQPVEDSLAILWDVVSTLHDSGWHEDDIPRAIPRLWKKSIVEPRLSNMSSLSLPEDFVTADTIPIEITKKGPCEVVTSPGMDVGTTRYEDAQRRALFQFLVPRYGVPPESPLWPLNLFGT